MTTIPERSEEFCVQPAMWLWEDLKKIADVSTDWFDIWIHMPKFLEDRLKKEYPDNPHAVWGTMNKLKAVHGNKITKKGMAMERKHASDVKKGLAKR